MIDIRNWAAIALAVALSSATAAAATAVADKPQSYSGQFETPVLAGGEVNELKIPVQPINLRELPGVGGNSGKVTITWVPNKYTNNKTICPGETGSPKLSEQISVLSKRTVKGDDGHTILLVQTPRPPCYWPLNQVALITIKGNVAGVTDDQILFEGKVPISVGWFPLLLTLAVLLIIYPGCAMVAYYLAWKNYEDDCKEAQRKGKAKPQEPTFLAALDPVQISAGPHGRASLAKLQIFVFSVLVFGLLFYYQFRYGIMAGISKDVMLLMGISAVGAAGAKITYTKKRRLSLESWTWLVRKGWLPPAAEVQPRAKWSELVLDSDTKEFDPYSFQMAVFSLVVAVALVRSGLAGLGGFEIPQELLTLLGLSQAVFIGGKAIEKSSYEELEKQIKDVRDREIELLAMKAGTDDEKKARDEKLKAFRESAGKAADMFWAVYIDQLPDRSVALAKEKIAAMLPGGFDSVVPK